MTQEDKELLIKDLSARLPYGVKFLRESWNYEWDVEVLEDINKDGYISHAIVYKVKDIKPYLRSMSSMTEEEWQEYQTLKMTDWVEGDINGVFINAGTITDWLNAHHFDYRGLIDKGLAIEAPEEMYNIN